MSYSLNEIEALSKRAARGAGLSWGMAEETGKATRWLAAHDLPGVALLAGLLVQNDGTKHSDHAPQALAGIWSAQMGRLCPLSSGAALNDCADILGRGEDIQLDNVSHPLMVVPFAAWAAIHIDTPVSITWLDVKVQTDGYRLRLDDPDGQVNRTKPVTLICTATQNNTDTGTMPAQRGTVCPAGWAQLNGFAHRTYAPATEQSRLLGAGAGVSDND